MIISVLPTDLITIIISLLGASSKFSLMRVSVFFETLMLRLQPSFASLLSPIIKNKILMNATKYSNIFEWLVPEPYRLLQRRTYRYCKLAAKHGSLTIVKYLWYALLPNDDHDINDVYDVNNVYDDIFNEAIANGRMKIIKWIHRSRSRSRSISISIPGKQSCTQAAGAGQLEILKYLRSVHPKYPFDSNTFAEAAKCGKFEMAVWLRENDCPWNESTCAGAAEKNNLRILKYLRENGCPWNVKTFIMAAMKGHISS